MINEKGVIQNFIHSEEKGSLLMNDTIPNLLNFLIENKVSFKVTYDTESGGDEELEPVLHIEDAAFEIIWNIIKEKGMEHEVMM